VRTSRESIVAVYDVKLATRGSIVHCTTPHHTFQSPDLTTHHAQRKQMSTAPLAAPAILASDLVSESLIDACLTTTTTRLRTGIPSLDSALNGGISAGSVLLVSHCSSTTDVSAAGGAEENVRFLFPFPRLSCSRCIPTTCR
jgi:hypothetical protein